MVACWTPHRLSNQDSEEDYSELTSSQKLEIVKSDVNFSAEASQGVIEVKTDRTLNATSERGMVYHRYIRKCSNRSCRVLDCP